jgi:hypothetical protein
MFIIKFHLRLLEKLIRKTNLEILNEVMFAFIGRIIVRIMHKFCKILKYF